MRCRLITERAYQWLHDGRPARILHLFDEVCNLINDQNQVISLAASHVGPGPFTLLLEATCLPHLDVHMPVRFDHLSRRLFIGSHRIYTDYANVWDSRPLWENLRPQWCDDWPEPTHLPAEIECALHKLLQSIANEDATSCQAAVYELAGRGNGLTPTGDDILVGALYGLWVWKPVQKWMDLIVETAAPRTTSLSAAFLRAAAAGEATIHWHRLANGEAAAVEQILAIGHTSGRDAWAGFVHAGKILRNRVSNFGS